MMTEEQRIEWLLKLHEHPEQLTDEQMRQILADNEMRQLVQQLGFAKRAFKHDELKSDTPDVDAEWEKFVASHAEEDESQLGRAKMQSRAAAMFIGFLLISGLAFATIQLVRKSPSPQPSSEGMATANSSLYTLNSTQPSPVRFDDVCLDSILTVVSTHYGKTVSFRSDEAKGMKFIMTWDPNAPLSNFIDGLNLFDGLSLTLQHDTIFIEITEIKVGGAPGFFRGNPHRPCMTA